MDISYEFFREFMKSFLPPGDSLLTIFVIHEVGKNVVKIADNYDLVIFEYFLTDKTGSRSKLGNGRKSHTNSGAVYRRYPRCNGQNQTPTHHHLSDHGNLGNLTTATHTANPVPTYLYGKHTDSFKDKISALCDIVPLLYEKLGVEIELKWETVKE